MCSGDLKNLKRFDLEDMAGKNNGISRFDILLSAVKFQLPLSFIGSGNKTLKQA